MRYVSTRGASAPVSFLDAVLAGLAPDGGLYVPERWPTLAPSVLARAGFDAYADVAAQVLSAFAGDDLSREDAAAIADAAYAGAAFPPAVTPLVQTGPGDWRLELCHGPSLAFKDIAMQLIAPLYAHALARRDGRLTVVCATSGDTGGAAVEALKGHDRIDLFVLLPHGRVSPVQQRFMTASGAANVHPILIDGDFDDCQAIVKAMFADRDFADRASLSGVNSINWARILAQAVYYVVAAGALEGAPTFVVPTGNFGDAFAGLVAKRIGADVGRIVIASNANDILPRTLESGTYARAGASQPTLSPAMDIQVASNFERLVYEAVGRDGDATARLYAQFAQSGALTPPPEAMLRIRSEFAAGAADDAATQAAMRAAWRHGAGDMICPHTAVARAVLARLPRSGPVVTLATAHPAKFPDAVADAIGATPQLPFWCADLFDRPERFDRVANDAAAVKAFISQRSRAWRS
ncbi:MAG: threonine synthase [Alphaproteobacteria bacterium]|nr:threonine synthase [Alphaproteobacteria bacterium]